MPRPRLISGYYIYVDGYSDKCIDQSGMIDMTDASPDLNPGTLFFSFMLSIWQRKSVVGNPIVVHDNVIIN